MAFRLIIKIAIMNTAESLYMEMTFPVEEIKQMVVNTNKDKNSHHEKGGISINNYLKTPEEIDAELSSEMNSRKETFAEHKFLMDSYGTGVIIRTVPITTHRDLWKRTINFHRI
jgi:hypothetical protein